MVLCRPRIAHVLTGSYPGATVFKARGKQMRLTALRTIAARHELASPIQTGDMQ